MTVLTLEIIVNIAESGTRVTSRPTFDRFEANSCPCEIHKIFKLNENLFFIYKTELTSRYGAFSTTIT